MRPLPSSDDDIVRPPDLRLVPAAMAAWVVVLLGLGLGPLAGSVVALLAGVTVVVAGRRGWTPVVIAAAGCAAAAGLVVTAHTLLVTQHPLRGAAERAAAATVRLVVRDDPRPVRGDTGYGSRPGGPTQVVVPATLTEATAGDGRWSTGGRVLLLAPASGWSALLPGQGVTADGLLAPAGRADLTVAVLRVRGPPRDVGSPPWWQEAAGVLRAGLREASAAVLSPAPAGLLPGLAIGDTGGLTTEVDADFRTAGLTHLLAVSGANLNWHVCTVSCCDVPPPSRSLRPGQQGRPASRDRGP